MCERKTSQESKGEDFSSAVSNEERTYKIKMEKQSSDLAFKRSLVVSTLTSKVPQQL